MVRRDIVKIVNKCNIKAVAYARVSTLLGQNPEAQLASIRQLAAGRGFQLTKEYVDEGISGSRERRPALDQLVRDAQAGKFTIIIVFAIDRLARDVRHLLNLVAELKHYGVALVSIREGLDFSTPIGQTVLTVIGSVAQLERELLRERVRVGMAVRRMAAEKRGVKWKCGRPTVVTTEIEAEIVALSEKGQSIRRISKQVGIAKTTVQRVLSDLKGSAKKAP